MINNLYDVLIDLTIFNKLKLDFIKSKKRYFEYKNIYIEKYYNKYTVFIKNVDIYDNINKINVPNNVKWLVMNKLELSCFLTVPSEHAMPCLYDLLRFIYIVNTDKVTKNKYLLIFPLYYGHGGLNHLQVSASYDYDKDTRVFHNVYGYNLKIDNNEHIQAVKSFINENNIHVFYSGHGYD